MSTRSKNKNGVSAQKHPPAVNESRRKLAKAGLLAPPVLLTVAARPAFAVPCLSNVLSGNLSSPGGGQCVLGLSPGYYKGHPEEWQGSVNGVQIKADMKQDSGGNWVYPSNCQECQGTSWGCSGGTPFNSVFGGTDTRSMFEVICDDSGSDAFHIIAALLNALLVPGYVLTVEQVLKLWNGDYSAYISNMSDFLDQTWT
jgi:hypothetical protein